MKKPHKIRRLGLFGVAGHNLGDDAICRCLITGLRHHAPDVTIVVAVRQPCSITEAPGISPFILDRRSIFGILRMIYIIWSVDAVMLGGGSLVQDQFGGGRLRGILGYVWTVSFVARIFGKPIFTAPIGVDRLNHAASHAAAAEFLLRTEVLTVRDPLSAENAVRITDGQIKDRLEEVYDPVFDFEPSEQGADLSLESRYYVLAPAYEGRHENTITALFAACAEKLAAVDHDCDIVIVAMDSRGQEDDGKNPRILELLNPDIRRRIRLITPESPEAAAHLLRSSQGLIAMRLHALIMAYSHTALYCFSRSTKTEALMKFCDIQGQSFEHVDDEDAAAEAAVTAIRKPVDLTSDRTKLVSMKTQIRDYYSRMAARFSGGLS